MTDHARIGHAPMRQQMRARREHGEQHFRAVLGHVRQRQAIERPRGVRTTGAVVFATLAVPVEVVAVPARRPTSPRRFCCSRASDSEHALAAVAPSRGHPAVRCESRRSAPPAPRSRETATRSRYGVAGRPGKYRNVGCWRGSGYSAACSFKIDPQACSTRSSESRPYFAWRACPAVRAACRARCVRTPARLARPSGAASSGVAAALSQRPCCCASSALARIAARPARRRRALRAAPRGECGRRGRLGPNLHRPAAVRTIASSLRPTPRARGRDCAG